MNRRMPATSVNAVLERAFAEHGAPEYIRSDNGPEFVTKATKSRPAERDVKTHYIDPASP
jgi:putative transposase